MTPDQMIEHYKALQDEWYQKWLKGTQEKAAMREKLGAARVVIDKLTKELTDISHSFTKDLWP